MAQFEMIYPGRADAGLRSDGEQIVLWTKKQTERILNLMTGGSRSANVEKEAARESPWKYSLNPPCKPSSTG